jgi:peptidyl-prolyl cis-trans isomerase D
VLSNPANPKTDYFTNGQMVKEFNDFSFEGKTGERKIVKTVFGYHLVEILDQKNFEPHYKAAYFSKNIVASDETDRTALSNASKFASESRDLKAFEENYQKNLAKQGYQKLLASNIRPNDNTIEGINLFGTSRQLVREIYKADKGDVLQQTRVGDKYIVAAVTDVFNEGTMSVASARVSVEPLLRNKKKAEQIKQKLGKISTLEAAAATFQEATKTLDSLRMDGGQLGFEPRVVGAAFNAANKGKVISEPITGISGVYVVRVDDLTSTPTTPLNKEEETIRLRQNAMQMAMYSAPPAQILRKSAKIKDNRSTFY